MTEISPRSPVITSAPECCECKSVISALESTATVVTIPTACAPWEMPPIPLQPSIIFSISTQVGVAWDKIFVDWQAQTIGTGNWRTTMTSHRVYLLHPAGRRPAYRHKAPEWTILSWCASWDGSRTMGSTSNVMHFPVSTSPNSMGYKTHAMAKGDGTVGSRISCYQPHHWEETRASRLVPNHQPDIYIYIYIYMIAIFLITICINHTLTRYLLTILCNHFFMVCPLSPSHVFMSRRLGDQLLHQGLHVLQPAGETEGGPGQKLWNYHEITWHGWGNNMNNHLEKRTNELKKDFELKLWWKNHRKSNIIYLQHPF